MGDLRAEAAAVGHLCKPTSKRRLGSTTDRAVQASLQPRRCSPASARLPKLTNEVIPVSPPAKSRRTTAPSRSTVLDRRPRRATPRRSPDCLDCVLHTEAQRSAREPCALYTWGRVTGHARPRGGRRRARRGRRKAANGSRRRLQDARERMAPSSSAGLASASRKPAAHRDAFDDLVRA